MRPETKYKAIARRQGQYPVIHMCSFFGISRSGYYAYKKRCCFPDKDIVLARQIEMCQRKSHRSYGYRRVGIWLKRAGIYVNHKKVLRVMRKYDQLSQARRKKQNYQQGKEHHQYRNLLSRDFKAARPNEKWVTDISYIQTSEGFLYLSAILDLFDRSVVAYQTSTTQSTRFVLDTIAKATEQEKLSTPLQLHSDQGFQYASSAYARMMSAYGITPSMSRRGNCYDNAVMENFFGTLKAECLYRNKGFNARETRRMIDEYIIFYNHDRLQLKTELTPMEIRRQFR